MLFWRPEKCWWKWDPPPPNPLRGHGAGPLLPTVKVTSLLIFSPADRDEWPYLRSLMSRGPRLRAGPAPSATLPVTVREIDGRGSWSVFEEAALDLVRLSAGLSHWQARVSPERLIERLRLAGLCDTSLLMPTGPETRFPSPCTAAP